MILINMKAMKIKYLLVLFAILGFAGCHDVTVGYLRTTYAKYGIDSLHIGIGSYQAGIAEMDAKYPVLSEYKELREILDAIPSDELDAYLDESYELYDELEELDEVEDADRIAEIEARLAIIEPIVNALYRSWDIEGEFDYDEFMAIYEQYLWYFSAIASVESGGLPWTTATIEGVLGTEPITYSIANVTAEDGGDADVFKSELVMYGGGRMQLPFDCKAPKGKYRVSILVENEGYSNIVENAFTFIVD